MGSATKPLGQADADGAVASEDPMSAPEATADSTIRPTPVTATTVEAYAGI
jgi:hypothetical protein